MLTITMPDASEENLTQTVTRCCALYGTVTSVRVHAVPSSPTMHPFALVAMDTRENAEQLARAFGGRVMGKFVVIQLFMPAAASEAIPRRRLEST